MLSSQRRLASPGPKGTAIVAGAPGPITQSLRQRLVEGTRKQHAELERHAGFGGEQPIDRPCLVRFVGAMVALLQGIERRSREAPDACRAGWLGPDRPRLAAFLRDAKRLGVPVAAGAELEPPPFRTLEDVLGWNYVAEGSALGGPAAARRVRRDCDDGVCRSLCSFERPPREVARRWRAFVDLLQGTPADAARTVAASRRAFEHAGGLFAGSTGMDGLA